MLFLRLQSIVLLVLTTAPFLISRDHQDRLDNYTEWGIYRGDKKGNQYAELAQINAANVHKLEPVWEYHAGDANDRSNMHSNPIIIDNRMYFTTSTLRAVAIDAGSGEEVWVFKAEEHHPEKTVFRGRSRGLVYWESGDDKRIFHSVKDRVYALNAITGELIRSFGEEGHLDLRQNLGMDPEKASIEVTNPGIVYKNFLIVISRVPEGYDSTPGHIRAYDTITGEFKWIFHTIPKKGEFGYDTWEFVEGEKYGGANSWGGLTLDERRGWVFAATGSPSFDFYGGYRKGMNLFGNCVLALDATTGERIWHYQTVHHDLWDYDNPPAPILVTIQIGDQKKDAVVQLTKTGLTFVLDRETGEPLFPVEEIPVPPSTVEGEEAWPTQPIPLKPVPLTRLGISASDLSNINSRTNNYLRRQFARFVSGTLYTPPSEQGTISQPGHLGGSQWHGGSYDPYTNMLYVNVNDAPAILKLRKMYEPTGDSHITDLQRGRVIYEKNCTVCHGRGRLGIPPIYPSVLKLEEIVTWIRSGGNIMPAFPHFTDDEVSVIAKYMTSDLVEMDPQAGENAKVRYLIEGYSFFKDQNGYLGINPPWGTLNAIDLSSGDLVWKIPLGEYPKLVEQGIRNTGTLNFGGAVTTAGGLIFIAATADEKIRAFEKSRGKLLWEYKLPAGGYATPSVYSQNGRQYVVIVCGGGGKNRTPSGDSIMAFALPMEKSKDTTIYNADSNGWIELFDGKTLNGWVHMNGSHSYTVEDGAIVGRTATGSPNSFLCSLQEFKDFELEVETMVDDITNQGVQFRSSVRPVSERDSDNWRAGRVWGPQVDVSRNLGENINRSDGIGLTTGMLYGEALGTGWISSQEKRKKGHDFFVNEGWNKLRIVADGPRIQTWVNGHPVEDLVDEEVYKTHFKGFIGLQIHGIRGERQFIMKWRNIRIRPL